MTHPHLPVFSDLSNSPSVALSASSRGALGTDSCVQSNLTVGSPISGRFGNGHGAFSSPSFNPNRFALHLDESDDCSDGENSQSEKLGKQLSELSNDQPRRYSRCFALLDSDDEELEADIASNTIVEIDPPTAAGWNAMSSSSSSSSSSSRGELAIDEEAEEDILTTAIDPKLRDRMSRRLSVRRVSQAAACSFEHESSTNRWLLRHPERCSIQPFAISDRNYQQLYEFQREGVRWLWERHCCGKGGLLGDDMGLGKTVQVVTFLGGLMASLRARRALILAPLSLVEQWANHFRQWTPEISVISLQELTPKRRLAALRQMVFTNGIAIATYGVVTSQSGRKLFDQCGFQWDYVILDEGHKIKSPAAKVSTAVREIRSAYRVLLTGTPVQNNLMELWSLFDFVCEGVLGTQASFKRLVADRVSRGNERCASSLDKSRGEETMRALRALIAPYFLRREKRVMNLSPATPGSPLPGPSERSRDGFFTLPCKFDTVVWVRPTAVQMSLYRTFLRSAAVKTALADQKRSPLTALTMMKKVCDHPWLLLEEGLYSDALSAVHQKGIDVVLPLPAVDGMQETGEGSMCEVSQKLATTFDLLLRLKDKSRRVLLFSMSCKLLNLVQLWLHSHGLRHSRIDGSLAGCERQSAVDQFNSDHTIFCCLLTTQVGGVGLTLTGADRVIILDPCWNPSTDNQAIDRAHRLGQTAQVVVYRMVTCGTVEEKMYRRQIFKQGIALQTNGRVNLYRHFSQRDLREMFALGDTDSSETAQQLRQVQGIEDAMEDFAAMAAAQPGTLGLQWLLGIDGVVDCTNHGRVFDAKEVLATCPAAEEEARAACLHLADTQEDAPLQSQRMQPIGHDDVAIEASQSKKRKQLANPSGASHKQPQVYQDLMCTAANRRHLANSNRQSPYFKRQKISTKTLPESSFGPSPSAAQARSPLGALTRKTRPLSWRENEYASLGSPSAKIEVDADDESDEVMPLRIRRQSDQEVVRVDSDASDYSVELAGDDAIYGVSSSQLEIIDSDDEEVLEVQPPSQSIKVERRRRTSSSSSSSSSSRSCDRRRSALQQPHRMEYASTSEHFCDSLVKKEVDRDGRKQPRENPLADDCANRVCKRENHWNGSCCSEVASASLTEADEGNGASQSCCNRQSSPSSYARGRHALDEQNENDSLCVPGFPNLACPSHSASLREAGGAPKAELAVPGQHSDCVGCRRLSAEFHVQEVSGMSRHPTDILAPKAEPGLSVEHSDRGKWPNVGDEQSPPGDSVGSESFHLRRSSTCCVQ
eukprot:NODE_24_length_4384_cov_21.877278_g21_i0.p1 GENE.NODE_24_length_4384_cov_21.877278_g21_i0~~NODE_24_length_4384_cov_21.877278_g21_i0.p1  ORF type:complete len:1300 (-),score=249.74 NODE_24_length_4384_cov_21.877278_g21_i0:485-4309(-)